MAEAKIFYQAIGELYASLVVTEAGTKLLDTGENQYRAIVPKKVESKYQKIQGESAYWRVYPQFQYGHLTFVIVSFSEKPKREPGRFYIQGDKRKFRRDQNLAQCRNLERPPKKLATATTAD